MPATYPATFKDRSGEERASIHNDGAMLSLTVRGVEFRGEDFDVLEPTSAADPDVLSSFPLQRNALCSCVIDAEIAVPVVTPDGAVMGVLAFRLELGDPAPNGGIDRERLTLRLRFGDRGLTSSGWSGWFEDELADLQEQMREGEYLKACINCAFSDYSPSGHGLFGGLACFRDNKAVTTKRALFQIWGTMTEFVQETHSAPSSSDVSPEPATEVERGGVKKRNRDSTGPTS